MKRALAGRRRVCLGFTLLEVLVVLGILAMAGATLFGWNRNQPTGLGHIVFSRMVQAELRLARAAAISSNAEALVVFDSGARTIEAGGRRLSIPATLSVEVTGADAERRDLKAIGIRFFPTGRSTGGIIRLESANKVGAVEVIAIHWLTGQVESGLEGNP
jgi:general secretion pathway protein H